LAHLTGLFLGDNDGRLAPRHRVAPPVARRLPDPGRRLPAGSRCQSPPEAAPDVQPRVGPLGPGRGRGAGQLAHPARAAPAPTDPEWRARPWRPRGAAGPTPGAAPAGAEPARGPG
jgi:hypothetical protein